MKLSPILAEYLYQHKVLQLAGIGRFRIDSQVIIDPEQSRNNKQGQPLNISFEQDKSVEADPALIQFISSETGKMKSLAAADLDSHLELARQFINIGKPFLFEGIGTLVKKKSGQFEFSPGMPINERVKDQVHPPGDPTSSTEESFTQFSDVLGLKKSTPPSMRRVAAMLAVLLGLALAVWAGYGIYKKGSSVNPNRLDTATLSNTPPATTIVDTSGTETERNSYRFVIEKAPKTRALDRYKALKSYGVKVNLETRDSIQYRLVMELPATAADTTRIRDSISALYVNARFMKSGKALVE